MQRSDTAVVVCRLFHSARSAQQSVATSSHTNLRWWLKSWSLQTSVTNRYQTGYLHVNGFSATDQKVLADAALHTLVSFQNLLYIYFHDRCTVANSRTQWQFHDFASIEG